MFDLGPGNNIILKDKSLLLIKEFKKIWNDDSSKTKDKALKEFAYIYLKNDFKSSYRNAYSKDEISDKLKTALSLPINWKPTKDIIQAEEVYNNLQTTKSLKALMAAEIALEQVTKYFTEFDITKFKEENVKAEAVKKLMANIKDIDEVTGKLEAAKKRLERELSEKNLSGSKILTSRELPKRKRK